MIAYILVGLIWVTLEQSDGTFIECSTDRPIEYFPGIRLVHVRECGDRVFADGFEDQ